MLRNMNPSFEVIKPIHRPTRRRPAAGFQYTPATSKTASDSLFRQESLDSVTSLCHSLDSSRFTNDGSSSVESKLAFTTEELTTSRLPPKESSQFPSIHPFMKPSRIRARQSVMSANNDSTTMTPAAAHSFHRRVYRSRSSNSYPGDNSRVDTNPPLRVRPTVTSILRQHHVLERAEKDQKGKVDSLMVLSSTAFETDSTIKRLEKMDADALKAKETKRLLEAKLTYERAKEASRKVADEKQKIAEETRQKEKEWQSLLAEKFQTDFERRKVMTGELRKSFNESKRAFDEMLQAKQERANRMKMELEKLQDEAKQKKEEEKIKRLDKIKQIQAAKLALKRTKETILNPNQFYRSIEVPETQIKLRLIKEAENRKLEEIRRKIQAEKQIKSVKLIKAMKKIQKNDSLSRQVKVPEFLVGKAY